MTPLDKGRSVDVPHVHHFKLTPTMRRHLRELAEIGPESAWGPESSGEWRCAEALERRGLLRRNVSQGQRPFSITPKGYEVGRDASWRDGVEVGYDQP